jgi:catechol 2,3-dioxygenase-like lactoylglutathione lyase family enzyme
MAPLPHAVGINHVALEVDDLERAIAFYSSRIRIRNVERAHGGAFLDLGDQFIALFPPGAGEDRHFGLVVDDLSLLPGPRDFHDPFGNRIQVVQYDRIQFLKHERVLSGMGLPELGKSEDALAELRANGLT